MKVVIELFGGSRDFSDKNSIELNIKNNSTIRDVRKEMLDYLDLNFKGNKNFIESDQKSSLL